MNVNNLCFSCECTISSVDLLWGRWGCLSPASKVLNASTYKCFHLHRNRVPSQRIQNTFLCSDSDRLNAIGRSIRGKLCCYWKRFSPTSYIPTYRKHCHTWWTAKIYSVLVSEGLSTLEMEWHRNLTRSWARNQICFLTAEKKNTKWSFQFREKEVSLRLRLKRRRQSRSERHLATRRSICWSRPSTSSRRIG